MIHVANGNTIKPMHSKVDNVSYYKKVPGLPGRHNVSFEHILQAGYYLCCKPHENLYTGPRDFVLANKMIKKNASLRT